MTATDVNEKWLDAPPEAESIAPDLVAPPSGATLERVQDGNDALAAAEAAALAMPGAPGMDEFLALAMQARMLSLSGAAPKLVRDNPYIAFHVAMVGRDLGISPSAAIELIDVIETQGGPRLSLSPQLLNAQIRRLGLGSIVPEVQERERCIAAVLDANGTKIGETEFTWEDAQDAGLAGPECRPGAHKKTRREGRQGRGSYERCPCNQGYITYPKRMMWWRAAGFAADDWYPEAGLGLYSPEALGAVVDAEGRPIDPTQVALPPGYEDPIEIQQARQEQAQAQAERPADPHELWALQERVRRLPAEWRSQMLEAWEADGCNVKGYSLKPMEGRQLVPHRKLGVVRGLINAWEGEARKAGVDLDGALAALRAALAASVVGFLCWGGPPRTEQAPEGPETAPEPPAAPDTHDDPSAATSGDEGPASDTPSDSAPAEPSASAPDVEDQDEDDPPEMAYERPDGAPEPNWDVIIAGLRSSLEKACQDVPDGVLAELGREAKALHHAKVNTELRAAGVPTDGHIDVRRMHVMLLRLKAYRAEHDLGPIHYHPDLRWGAVSEPPPGEEPF